MILIPVIIFVIAVGLFTVYFAGKTAIHAFVSQPLINASIDGSKYEEGTNKMFNLFDALMSILFVGVILSLMISSYYIESNLIFGIIYLFFIVVGTIISPFLSNVWETLTSNSVFGTQILSFPITNFIVTHLPLFMVAIGFIGFVLIFGKPRQEYA